MELDGPREKHDGQARSRPPVGQQSRSPLLLKESRKWTRLNSSHCALTVNLRAAIAVGDFDKVRRIDRGRQELLHRIAAEDAVEGDEDLFEFLEGFSSEVAKKTSSRWRNKSASLSRRASGQFKVLDGYRI